MAHRFPDHYNRDTPTDDKHFDRQTSSRNSLNSDSTHISRLSSQRQLSDSRTPTTCFILFENANSNEIRFFDYLGTRARYHHFHRLYLPQVTNNGNRSSNETKKQFADSIKQVLSQIPTNELSSYVISVRTGVAYFFSKRFRFNQNYSIADIHDVIQKRIPTSDNRYYYPPKNNSRQTDDSLRSSFSNVKPISHPREFVEELKNYHFYVKQQKHVFRIYLQSEDKQTHVCIIDPAANYSIVEFSKDFQRNSNIDFIRDRSSSKFRTAKTYDDIFDFRIQFQYNPRTCSDQLNTIEYELHQQFPLLDPNFKNENILKPFEKDDQEFHISEHLSPYIQFIRRDFGDVYQYNGTDELFENFTIYLESSVEYKINKNQSTCQRSLDTHGLVYARLDLDTMISSNTIDENLLILKLWDMGTGLTSLAGQYTTSETQQSTNYYTPNGEIYTAEDEALVQRILKQSTIFSMLSLPKYATNEQIRQNFHRIDNQLKLKWHCVRFGTNARDKLHDAYEQFLKETELN